MGAVRVLTDRGSGVGLALAVATFLGTITVANTRRAYAAVLDRLVTEFGPVADVRLLGADPDRVAAWFDSIWGDAAPRTFNARLAAAGSACAYWADQGWLTGDPLVRTRTRPVPGGPPRALSRTEVEQVLGLDGVPLREKVLWNWLYESAARAQEVLALDIPDLDPANRQGRVVRKGGALDTISWQTGTARLLPRLLAGRRTGPVFLTDRKARPTVALVDVDPSTGRARLSYRRAAELFELHTARVPGGPFTLHQLRHAALTHAAEDGASTPMLMAFSGHTSVRSLSQYARPSAEALGRWRAGQDPAARRRTR
jgi:integrase/recombinase XerC/integrase/recombinase XerD